MPKKSLRYITRKIFIYSPFIIILGAIYYFSSLSSLPIDFSFQFQDKLHHATAFAFLGYSLYRILQYKGIDERYIWLIVMIFGTMYGLSDEIHQAFVPHRVFDWYDLCADVFGLIISCSLGKYVIRCDRRLLIKYL